jgi:uncharacterized protein YdhG (YjbR/CyaY superfamily)
MLVYAKATNASTISSAADEECHAAKSKRCQVERIKVADKFETVDEYLASFPPDVQSILKKARRAIRKAAPGVKEVISYQIISFKVNGKSLVYLGGWKHHLGLYPVPVFDKEFEEQISQYRAAKDTLRFPLRKPIPYDLIERVVTRLMSRQESQR